MVRILFGEFGGESLFDFESGECHEYRHEGAQQVEKAIGQVGECTYSQYGSLGHAAGVPRDKYRSDRNRIFHGAAKQSAFQSAVLVQLFE